MESIGGQAVLEGVMMKNGKKIAVAVRRDQKIIVEKFSLGFGGSSLLFARGILNLYVMFSVGIRSLLISMRLQAKNNEKVPGSFSLGFSFILSLLLAVFLFKFLPLHFASSLQSFFQLEQLSFVVFEGLIKLGIFLCYLLLISRMKDVQRLFQYHGAEHKAVNCYESGKELSVKNAQSFTTIHRRCGTTFVFLVLFLSIFVYVFIPSSLSFWEQLGFRLLLLPVVASLSYEVLRLAARFEKNILLQIFVFPGLLLQRLTTREPSDDQVEVGLEALKSTL